MQKTLLSSARWLLPLLFVVGIALFLPTLAEAATYCVATTGNDSNAGTEASPFRTIQKAGNTVGPGDTVIVKGGVYAGFAKSNFQGTSGSPITFKAAAGEHVMLDRYITPYSACGVIELYGVSKYLVFDGFEITSTDPALDQMRQLRGCLKIFIG
jgi:hypothetical protein